MDFQKLFSSFSAVKAGVIGDVMLDSYMWGSVERISPEAPVPVVTLQRKEHRIGGGGNVALNLHSLGAQAFILSVSGNDEEDEKLNELFAANSINTRYSFRSAERITTSKTRIISRNQQMMRLDAEITNDLSSADEEKILQQVHSFIRNEKPQVIVFEDYNKGVLTEKVIAGVIKMCTEAGVITTVDPKRKNFFSYKGTDLFKPNLKEVKDALNLIADISDITSLQKIHDQLKTKLNHRASFITLSEKGVFYQKDNKSAIIPSHMRNIADVSGAGDTVIAAASLVFAVTGDIHLAAEVANIAGGLVCEEVGTVAINKDRLLKECEMLLR